jgi:hypothetical protein
MTKKKGAAVIEETAVNETSIDDKEYPKRKRIEGQWCDRVDSPLADYPGCIYVVTNLSSPQFVKFWEMTLNAPAGQEERMLHLWNYAARQHLVKQWHVQGVNEAHVADESGRSLPAVELAWLVIQATSPATARALNLPNLAGWWPNTTNTSTSGNGKDEPTPES